MLLLRERHYDVTLTVEVHLKGFVTFLLQVTRIKKRNKVIVKGKKGNLYHSLPLLIWTHTTLLAWKVL